VPEIDLVALDGEGGAWPDLAARSDVIHLTGAFQLAPLRAGMQSGRASVAFRFDLPDGRSVIAETSLRVLYSAVKAIAARHGEEFMT
jgi:hypothetical protein